MLGLLETVDLVEVGWTVIAAAATALSTWSWRQASGDYVLAVERRRVRIASAASDFAADPSTPERVIDRHVVRSVAKDRANARGRTFASATAFVVGILAMTQPAGEHRTPAAWVTIGLLYVLPMYLVWRNITEQTARRQTIKDLARELRNENGGS